MDPLNAGSWVEDKKLASSVSNTESHDAFTREEDEKGETSKAPTFQPQSNSTEHKDDENFVFVQHVNPDQTEGQPGKPCSIDNSYFDGKSDGTDTPPTSSARSEDWVKTSLDHKTASVSNENDQKCPSPVRQPNPAFEEGMSESISTVKTAVKTSTLGKSESANYENIGAEDIKHGNSSPLETIIGTSVTSSVNRFPNQAELHTLPIELGRVVADLRNLDEYSKKVLDSSKTRLHDIVGRLENIEQENQLSVDVKNMITEVNTRLEVLKEHVLPKNKDQLFTTEEDTSEAKPDIVVAKPETPLIVSNDIDLLLIGSSGNGKSATGNAILRKNVFQTAAGTSSNASISAKGSSKYNDLTINVVDARGVDTNGKSKLEVLELSLQSIKEALELCEYSFTALLIVIKFGARFTQHEKETIKMIRGILGNDVIQKYGVCVVTHGDNFESEMAEEEEKANIITFEEWCHAQEGEIGELFKECSFRCVLFNNRSKDATKREDQLEKLISLIRHTEKYSRNQFLKADEGLSKLTQELFLPEVLQNTNKKVNDMRSKMVTSKCSFDSNDFFEMVNEMLRELNHYKESILAACWDESAKSNILCVIEPMELELNSKLKLYNANKVDRRPLLKGKSFDENYFRFDERDAPRNPTGDTIKEETVSSQLEIIEKEKAIKIILAILKYCSESLTNEEDLQTWLNYQIKQLKDNYYEFLSSESGKRMLREITNFQTEIPPTRNSPHSNESKKWEIADAILKSIKQIISFFGFN